MRSLIVYLLKKHFLCFGQMTPLDYAQGDKKGFEDSNGQGFKSHEKHVVLALIYRT